MDAGSIVAIIDGLNQAKVRYLVVGGLAVVAHGYVRFTADIDLVLDFDENNLKRATEALSALGYRPRAPVPLEQFADNASRRAWIEQKGLTVFSLWSPGHPMTELDLFTEKPFTDFDRALKDALRKEVAPGVVASFASLQDMVELKRQAGRPRDLEDIQKLSLLAQDGNDDEST